MISKGYFHVDLSSSVDYFLLLQPNGKAQRRAVRWDSRGSPTQLSRSMLLGCGYSLSAGAGVSQP
jgi:hypothetical protein